MGMDLRLVHNGWSDLAVKQSLAEPMGVRLAGAWRAVIYCRRHPATSNQDVEKAASGGRKTGPI